MDSAGKDEADLIGGHAAVDRFGDGCHGLFPEDEAGPGPDVAAALAALEDEAARPVAEVLIEQSRARGRASRWRCPRRSSALAWSGRPPAINAKGASPRGPPQPARRSSGGTKPRIPTPQGRSPRAARRFPQQAQDFLFAKQSKGQEGKRALVCDGLCEGGDVADAGHRTLEDRVPGADDRRPAD